MELLLCNLTSNVLSLWPSTNNTCNAKKIWDTQAYFKRRATAVPNSVDRIWHGSGAMNYFNTAI